MGWMEEFLNRMYCSGPPGSTPPGQFVPNCVSGFYPPVVAGFPTYNFGTNDFSFELWWHWVLGPDSTRSDLWTIIGVADQTVFPRQGAILRVSHTGYKMVLNYNNDPGNGLTAIAGLWKDVPGPEAGWQHIVANFDRTGNMDLIMNGVTIDSKAINALDLGTMTCYPHIGQYGGDTSFNPQNWDWTYHPTWTPDYEHGWSTFTQGRGKIGPMAYHKRCLTNTEIEDSIQLKKVQDIPGTTIARWDWSKVEGQAGWDQEESHVIAAVRCGLVDPMGIPRGTDGTVTVPDQSGNSRSISVATRPT